MFEFRVSTESNQATEELPQIGVEDGPLLAAAVTVALVEYRRRVKEHVGSCSADGSGSRWRMATRVEQLRGRG